MTTVLTYVQIQFCFGQPLTNIFSEKMFLWKYHCGVQSNSISKARVTCVKITGKLGHRRYFTIQGLHHHYINICPIEQYQLKWGHRKGKLSSTLLILHPKLGHAGFVDYFDELIKRQRAIKRKGAGGVWCFRWLHPTIIVSCSPRAVMSSVRDFSSEGQLHPQSSLVKM